MSRNVCYLTWPSRADIFTLLRFGWLFTSGNGPMCGFICRPFKHALIIKMSLMFFQKLIDVCGVASRGSCLTQRWRLRAVVYVLETRSLASGPYTLAQM